MRLRFTIRDLLWLTLVVAMAVGWWVDRGHLAKELTETKDRTAAIQRENRAYQAQSAELSLRMRDLIEEQEAQGGGK